jgi:hypothetical protein
LPRLLRHGAEDFAQVGQGAVALGQAEANQGVGWKKSGHHSGGWLRGQRMSLDEGLPLTLEGDENWNLNWLLPKEPFKDWNE